MTADSVQKFLISVAFSMMLLLSYSAVEPISVVESTSPAFSHGIQGHDPSFGQPSILFEVLANDCDGECAGAALTCVSSCVSAGMPPRTAALDMTQTALRVSVTMRCLSGADPALDPGPPKAQVA